MCDFGVDFGSSFAQEASEFPKASWPWKELVEGESPGGPKIASWYHHFQPRGEVSVQKLQEKMLYIDHLNHVLMKNQIHIIMLYLLFIDEHDLEFLPFANCFQKGDHYISWFQQGNHYDATATLKIMDSLFKQQKHISSSVSLVIYIPNQTVPHSFRKSRWTIRDLSGQDVFSNLNGMNYHLARRKPRKRLFEGWRPMFLPLS